MHKFKKIFIFLLCFLAFTSYFIAGANTQNSKYSTYYNFSELLKEHHEKHGDLRNSDIKKLLQDGEKGNAEAYYTLGFMYYRGFQQKSFNVKTADFSNKTIQSYETALKYFKKASDMGHSRASYVVGYIYDHGQGIKKNIQIANTYYKKAVNQKEKSLNQNSYNDQNDETINIDIKRVEELAENGDSDAQLSLGREYLFGKIVNKDPQKALKYIKKSAEQGNSIAQFFLGSVYLGKLGIEKNYDEAVKWFKKSAEQGDENGMLGLAGMYLYGLSVPKDIKRAIILLEKASDKGSSESSKQLGDMYNKGLGVAKDQQKAQSYYKKVKEQKEQEKRKLIQQAREFEKKWKKTNQNSYNNQTTEEIHIDIKKIEKLAENGDSNAQFFVGRAYLLGKDVNKDTQKALKFLKKSSEQGNSTSQVVLATAYLGKIGIKENYDEAVKWFKKSAEQGDKNGMMGLAGMYLYGLSVPKDIKKAISLLKKASDKGSSESSKLLGDIYNEGFGVVKDQQKAQSYYQKAKEQEEQEERERIQQMENFSKKFDKMLKNQK